MDERFRILRVVIASAVLLFVVKVVAIATGTDTLVSALVGMKSAVAEEKQAATTEPPKTVDGAAGPAGKEAGKEHAAGDGKDAGAEPSAKEAQGEHADPAADDSHEAEGETAPAAASSNRNGQTLSRSEIDVLENLSKRRTELDQRARDLDLREKMLIATEDRLNGRISELKTIEANIQTLLGTRDEAQQAQLASIVKVYETMKAKDAARIFEQLDMTILLPVAQKMKSAKLAPVLAEMNADAAKKLTVSLATYLNASSDAESPPKPQTAAKAGAQGG